MGDGRRSTLGPRWVNRGSPIFGGQPWVPAQKSSTVGPRDQFSLLRALGNQTKLSTFDTVAFRVRRRPDRFHALRRAPPLHSPCQKFGNTDYFLKIPAKAKMRCSMKHGRQPSNQLRGAQDAATHACSTGLSTGHHLMPMKALCGAASQCRGATTVRQLQTRGELWEAAGCVEHTERVQLQWHCEGVDENSAALACEGVDENARAWTKTRGNPDSCIGACQQRIDAVCRAGSASAVPSAQPPKSECEHASWLLASKTRSLQTFLAITLSSRAAPSIADCVDRTELMQGISWLCGLHCCACLGLDCHDFRMPMQLHTLCVLHTASSFPQLASCLQLSKVHDRFQESVYWAIR